MPKGYWISRLDVTDAEAYKPYLAGADAAIDAYGGRFLVRGGSVERLEGTALPRNVLVEFADFDTALACFHSPVYQEAYRHRLAASIGDHVIVEGHDGAQPWAADGPPTGPDTAYWIMRIDVTDPETYQRYIAADALALTESKGWFLVRGGRHEAVHGPARARNVVLAFASRAQALAAYHDPAYQAALAFRTMAAVSDVIVAGGA